MDKKRSAIFTGIFLFLTMKPVTALFSPDSSLVVSGKRQEHTRGVNGNYKHPFDSVDPHISSIHYPDEKSFTLRLTQEKRSLFEEESVD